MIVEASGLAESLMGILFCVGVEAFPEGSAEPSPSRC